MSWKRNESPLDFLQKIKVTRTREPQLIVDAALTVLHKGLSSLTIDKWGTKEELCLAYLDTNQLSEAQAIVDELEKQFPNSQRVGRLRGLVLEAHGKFSEAEKTYDELLEQNPANQLLMLRKVAVLKGRGRISQAVNKLQEFVDTYQADPESWKELGLLHLSLGNYQAASFCFAEVMLFEPQNYICPLMYAEVIHTVGGIENMIVARKYFSHSINLNEDRNARALWGLATSTTDIAEADKGATSKTKLSETETDRNNRLHAFAADQLTKAYEATAPKDLFELTKRVLEKQQKALQSS